MNNIDNTENPEITSGTHLSYWTDSAPQQALNSLNQNLETQVVIIGGGIAGLSAAYCLSKSGKKVVVLEDGEIGSGETGRTTAQLCTALDDRYYEFEKTFGEEKTKLIAQSHAGAINFVEKTIASEGIDCEFERVSGYLFRDPSDDADALEKEFEAASKAGVALEKVHHIPGMLQEQSGLEFKNQGQFHPLKYILGLKKAIEAHGGKIYTKTHVEEISKDEVTTSAGVTVKAEAIVVATNAPINSMFVLPSIQVAYRTYVIGALVKTGLLPYAQWWDTGDFNVDAEPYHYVRLQRYNDEYDLLICGGEDHVTGDTSDTDVAEEDRYARLEEWARLFFPIEKIVYNWSGQCMEPMDGVAYIGKNPFDNDNVYIITGDSGNGMTHGTLGGIIISDLINGIENPWADVYSPSRFNISESGTIFKKLFENLMYFFKKAPGSKAAVELSAIGNDEGRIVNLDNKKVGAYRNANGQLHIVAAECTHLKCIVAWNGDEKTWDCPCHGSRFSYDGKVVNGPANIDLQSYSEAEAEK